MKNKRVKFKSDKQLEPLFNRWLDSTYGGFLKEIKSNKRIPKRMTLFDGLYDLRFINLRKTRINDTNIESACLDGMIAYNANIRNTVFRNCKLVNGDLEEIIAYKFSITDSELGDCSFKGGDLTGCSFYNSTLNNCILAECKIDELDINGAIFQNCDFLDMINPEDVLFRGMPKSVKGSRIDRFSYLKLKDSQFKLMIKDQGRIEENNSGYEYDVALSFAGEQREYVEKVAEYLKDNHIRTFYDKYESHKLWGKELVSHLTELYSVKSKYVIVFISKDYANKGWTNVERVAFLSKILHGEYDKILPVMMDDTSLPGLTDTKAYLNGVILSANEIGEIFSKKFIEELVVGDRG